MIILKVLGLLLGSWMAVHLLALFGWFVTVAYLAWGLLVKKPPLAWRKAAGHSSLVVLISLLSVALVYGESKVLEQLGFSLTKKTAEFAIPSQGQYRLGEIFPMKIEIIGVAKPINAVQADLGFNPQQLEVVDISTADSFANIFIQKEINNDGGYARLTGGLPNPGWFSDRGTFGTVLFKGKAPGLAQVKFLPTSMVLANDGKGTNMIKDLSTASYLILPDKISKKEAELQLQLLADNHFVLGEKTQLQLNFYEPGSVLGIWAAKELGQGEVLGQATPAPNQGLGWLAKIDDWILSGGEKFYQSLLRTIKNLF